MIKTKEHKKIKVAVIDSGIDTKQPEFADYDIINYFYNGKEFCNTNACIKNYHGAEVACILLREASDIELVSLQILKENNRCSVIDLGEAIKFCIELNVKIISMSLGIINLTAEKQEYLHQLCISARKHGIFLFASGHNDETHSAFPAKYKEVIGIHANSKLKDFCFVNFPENNIEFSDDLFYMPDRHKYLIRRGNSYLTPFVVGLFCRYITDWNLREYDFFLEYINSFGVKQNVNKIFFSKNDEKERNILTGRRVSYLADIMDKNNQHVFSMYREVCDIKLCILNTLYEDEENILKYFQDREILFIGALSTDFIIENKLYLRNIIRLLLENQKGIITLFPILNSFERIKLVSQYGGFIKSIYK